MFSSFIFKKLKVSQLTSFLYVALLVCGLLLNYKRLKKKKKEERESKKKKKDQARREVIKLLKKKPNHQQVNFILV